ncbi:hypothetical protein BDN70DRAFT_998846 [Pholiota conissans]|uniref:Uncharacterized protein n=1 Tax=Pholiota conissans TaxID=109636 RepID=A0A9P5YL03_9AGAR|nr:hypothetical protein BDN70DRAFT_998846 [Pholiota conissans]
MVVEAYAVEDARKVTMRRNEEVQQMENFQPRPRLHQAGTSRSEYSMFSWTTPHSLSNVNDYMLPPYLPRYLEFVAIYVTLANENPTRAEAPASTLKVRDALNTPTIGNLTVPEIFSCELGDIHKQDLQVNDTMNTLQPSNIFLTSYLLSGLSFKYELTSCSLQYETILDALDAEPSSDIAELLIVEYDHSTSYFESADEVVSKLRAQKIARAVKDENALKLLHVGFFVTVDAQRISLATEPPISARGPRRHGTWLCHQLYSHPDSASSTTITRAISFAVT